MQKSSYADTRRSILLSLFVLGMITALIVLPSTFQSEASKKSGGLFERTSAEDPNLPKMWDIREDKASIDTLARFRESVGKDASAVADTRDRFVRGEAELKAANPDVKVEYNNDIRIPEVITPDVFKPKMEFLTPPSSARRVDILRGYIKQHNDLVGMTPQQIDGLKVAADYTNPDGNLSYVHLDQLINGVPVFRGEVKAGFTQDNRIIRVINNLAPGLEYGSLSSDFRDPMDAVKTAARHIGHELTAADTARNPAESTPNKVVFGSGDWATTAERMYFPTEPGVAVPAWRVLIWDQPGTYYVIVDSRSNVVLWHKNITDDQTQPATYQVYTNPASYLNVADSAAPLSPYISAPPNDPTVGAQGALITRNSISLIGNEGALSFNNNGWMTDGTNLTDGNANEAGIDRVSPNGNDFIIMGDAACPGAGCRTFTSTWSPPGPGNPGDEPLTPQAQRGAVIQMFYVMNRYHDELYLRGFTEEARNFQHDNFGRGGVAADRVSSEGQDNFGTSCTSNCFNNANFATPADGGRGRMQMYLWNGPTPDRDGTADADIIIHEVTHGTSHRLHGNGSGLGNQGGMMGEGWGDWYAHTMLAEPTDSPTGIVGLGGYSLFQLGGSMTSNYYHGIRRFPTAVIASTGGPMNKPHNPLTFGHINVGCDTTLGTTTTAVASAFPRNPVIATSGSCSQVHNAGEIWKSALWEVRSLFVARRGFASGTTAVLQVVTDGMKMSPISPTMLQERDAIAAAASTLPSNDVAADRSDVLEGFRRRGMGFSASVTSASVVTEAFDAATLSSSNTPSVTSGNGLLEPNECNTLNVPLINNGPNPATGITAVLSSSTPGITVTQPNSAYPDIPAGGGPVANTTPFQVSIDNTVACFTQASFTLTVTFSGSGGGSPLVSNFSLPVGLPGDTYVATSGTGTAPGNPANRTLLPGSQVDDSPSIALPLPAGWTSMVYNVPVTSLSVGANGILQINGTAPTVFTNTALPHTSTPTGPRILPFWDDHIMTTARGAGLGVYTEVLGAAPNRQLVIEWRAQHFNGGVNENMVTINHTTVLNEGSSAYSTYYTLTGAGAQANGSSATVGVQATNSGTQFTQFSFNSAVIMPGMKIDWTLPAGQCTPGTGGCNVVSVRSRGDFDGDGKTDYAVYRPSDANWYQNRSGGGIVVVNWGNSTDEVTPGDYDGDAKTDTAVFRASTGTWYIINSLNGSIVSYNWGQAGDIPVAADFDGDSKTDVAVYRPANFTWYVIRSTGGVSVIVWGAAGDLPVPGDYNGNGKADFAVYRPSNFTWYIQTDNGQILSYVWGAAGDRPVNADYDGDNRDDVAVFRPSNFTWYVIRSTGGISSTPWGANGDVPVPGDYNGDGSDDLAVYRNGTWFVQLTGGGIQSINWGVATDKPIPAEYIP